MLTSAPVAALNRWIESCRMGCHLGFGASDMIQRLTVLPLPFRSPLRPEVVLLPLLPHAAAPSSVAASAAATAIRRFTRSSSIRVFTRWTSCPGCGASGHADGLARRRWFVTFDIGVHRYDQERPMASVFLEGVLTVNG